MFFFFSFAFGLKSWARYMFHQNNNNNKKTNCHNFITNISMTELFCTCNKSLQKNPEYFSSNSYRHSCSCMCFFIFSFFILHSVFYFVVQLKIPGEQIYCNFIKFIMVVAYWPKFLLLWFLDMFFPILLPTG